MSQTEAQTRAELIDQQLAHAGWNIGDTAQVIEEFGVQRTQTQEIRDTEASYQTTEVSDDILLGRNGKPLAVVEAKRSSKDAETGREQAKQYCYNIQQQKGGELPFCFYTNGHQTYFWNLEQYPPRQIVNFPTRDDLERLDYLRRSKKPLSQQTINTNIAGRDYQIRAFRSVLEAIENKKRQFLLVMATGTGKTRTCIALIDSVMRASHISRVLFLVDRIALREQALDAFKEHLPNEPRWPKEGEKFFTKDRSIYVATYPTMQHIITEDQPSVSPHFFDLIVIDESHRSIYNRFGDILNYFDAITLGLTATPTDVIDHNTFKLFDCEDGLPTFAYSYHEALQPSSPYLNRFEVLKIRTRFQVEGINSRTISLEDQKKLIVEGKESELEEINFEGKQLEKQVTNQGTNTLIIKEFMEECLKDDNGVIPGKTIIFCASKAHARRMETTFDRLYPEYNGEIARVMVSDDPRVYGKNGLLSQFSHNNMPRIAISVDMLDTGIDIHEIVNLVFAKPVYSYTKFWQMIGRGTRLLDDKHRKPWCTHKDHFLIMDCWDNFDYFKLTPTGKTQQTGTPLPVRLVGLRIDKIAAAIAQQELSIRDNEIQKLQYNIAQLPQNSVMIKAALDDLHTVQKADFWQALDADSIDYLHRAIKPLFKALSGVDFKAMRFERDLLEYSLAQLTDDLDKADILQAGIVEQIYELPLSISFVKAQESLIRKAQSPHYWSTISEDKLDTLNNQLGP